MHSLDQTCILRKRTWWGHESSVVCGWAIAEGYLRQGYRFDWKATDETRQREKQLFAGMQS